MIKEISIDCSVFEHGGNIYRLAEALNIQERKIIDFSSSVNPLGVSKKIKAEVRKHLKYLDHYPDPEAKRLRKRLAQYHAVNPENILCGNGSTELIHTIARTINPKRILILAPTYSEYERACVLHCNSEVVIYPLRREKNFDIDPDEFIKALSCDMAFLCNPNSPTGRLLRKDEVLKIADASRENRCYLIVDEAFIDFTPDNSVVTEAKSNPYLIVLRSMSFFHALPGLRIGYGIFPQHLTARMKNTRERWTISSLAQRAAVIALKDRVYVKETLKLIAEEKEFIEKNFMKLRIEYFNSDTNFYLLRFENALELCNRLLKRGILLRSCSNMRGLDSTYLRIAVKNHRENVILMKELTRILL
jgi:threonine-phosphate decarboxylase